MRTTLCRVVIFLLLLGAFTVNGCAPLTSRPAAPIISDPARPALQKISGHNEAVISFKGLGQITIDNQKQRLQSRLALMGGVPDNLRLQVLDPAGRPLLAMSTDGRDFYFLEYGGESRFMKRSARSVSLEQIIGIPVPIEEIIFLLAGRIPLRPYHAADLAEHGTSRTRLVLSNRKGYPLEIVHLHPETGLPVEIEFYDGSRGRPQYRARLIGASVIDGFKIPETIVLETADGSSAVIAIERYWVNAAVSPEQFILTPPPDQSRLP